MTTTHAKKELATKMAASAIYWQQREIVATDTDEAARFNEQRIAAMQIAQRLLVECGIDNVDAEECRTGVDIIAFVAAMDEGVI